MRRAQHITVVLCSATVLYMSGCMSIKDTRGIKKYFEDQGKAEMLAIQIKGSIADTNEAGYRKTEMLYNHAGGVARGWTSGIVFDARVKREVNISVETYTNSEAGKAIGSFLALDTGIRAYSFDPGTGAAIAGFVVTLLDKMEQQNDRRVERAVEAIEHEFSRARWTTFEKTTHDWINEKYGSHR